MKLHHAGLANQKLSLAGGKSVQVNAEGIVEIDDNDLLAQLKVVGFKIVFSAKAEPKPEPKPVEKDFPSDPEEAMTKEDVQPFYKPKGKKGRNS